MDDQQTEPKDPEGSMNPSLTWAIVLRKALYWFAVLIVSLAVLIALILLLESRDKSSVSGGVRVASVAGVDTAAQRR